MTDPKKVLPKVIPNKIGVETKKLSIDHAVIEMLRSLELPDNTTDFSESLAIYAEKLAFSLKEAHQSLIEKNEASLEAAALKLSQHALRIGAVKMLRSSYELQNVARCCDFQEAAAIVEGLQIEYLRVRQDLENVV